MTRRSPDGLLGGFLQVAWWSLRGQWVVSWWPLRGLLMVGSRWSPHALLASWWSLGGVLSPGRCRAGRRGLSPGILWMVSWRSLESWCRGGLLMVYWWSPGLSWWSHGVVVGSWRSRGGLLLVEEKCGMRNCLLVVPGGRWEPTVWSPVPARTSTSSPTAGVTGKLLQLHSFQTRVFEYELRGTSAMPPNLWSRKLVSKPAGALEPPSSLGFSSTNVVRGKCGTEVVSIWRK